jgi:hypothetical protein
VFSRERQTQRRMRTARRWEFEGLEKTRLFILDKRADYA